MYEEKKDGTIDRRHEKGVGPRKREPNEVSDVVSKRNKNKQNAIKKLLYEVEEVNQPCMCRCIYVSTSCARYIYNKHTSLTETERWKKAVSNRARTGTRYTHTKYNRKLWFCEAYRKSTHTHTYFIALSPYDWAYFNHLHQLISSTVVYSPSQLI